MSTLPLRRQDWNVFWPSTARATKPKYLRTPALTKKEHETKKSNILFSDSQTSRTNTLNKTAKKKKGKQDSGSTIAQHLWTSCPVRGLLSFFFFIWGQREFFFFFLLCSHTPSTAGARGTAGMPYDFSRTAFANAYQSQFSDGSVRGKPTYQEHGAQSGFTNVPGGGYFYVEFSRACLDCSKQKNISKYPSLI